MPKQTSFQFFLFLAAGSALVAVGLAVWLVFANPETEMFEKEAAGGAPQGPASSEAALPAPSAAAPAAPAAPPPAAPASLEDLKAQAIELARQEVIARNPEYRLDPRYRQDRLLLYDGTVWKDGVQMKSDYFLDKLDGMLDRRGWWSPIEGGETCDIEGDKAYVRQTFYAASLDADTNQPIQFLVHRELVLLGAGSDSLRIAAIDQERTWRFYRTIIDDDERRYAASVGDPRLSYLPHAKRLLYIDRHFFYSEGSRQAAGARADEDPSPGLYPAWDLLAALDSCELKIVPLSQEPKLYHGPPVRVLVAYIWFRDESPRILIHILPQP